MTRGHRVIVDATPARFGGTAYALVQLATGLARAAEVDSVLVLARSDSLVANLLPSEVRLRSLRAHGRGELVRRVAWQAAHLDRIVRSDAATVVLTPGGMLPRRLGVPVVSYLLNPVALQDGEAMNRLRRLALVRTTRSAAAVLVPSIHMRELVESVTGRVAEIVPLGVAVSAGARCPGSGLLCVADLYRHKRHDVLLDAWQLLPPPRPSLRLIGNAAVDPGWAARIAERVRLLDGVTLEHGLRLPALNAAYRGAALFVLASNRESFSMPLAEAARCGLPALVRDAPALRETAGAGAAYLGSDDPAAWAQELDGLLSDGSRLRALGEAGRVMGSRYSVEAMTDAVIARLPSP